MRTNEKKQIKKNFKVLIPLTILVFLLNLGLNIYLQQVLTERVQESLRISRSQMEIHEIEPKNIHGIALTTQDVARRVFYTSALQSFVYAAMYSILFVILVTMTTNVRIAKLKDEIEELKEQVSVLSRNINA